MNKYSSNGRYRGHAGPLGVQFGPQVIEGRIVRVVVVPGRSPRVTISTGRNKYHGVWPDPDVNIDDWVRARVFVNQPKSDTFGFFKDTEILGVNK